MGQYTRAASSLFIIMALLPALSGCGHSNSSPTSPSSNNGSPAPPVSSDNASAHYVSAAQGNQPAIDMELFFTVSSGTSGLPFPGSRLGPLAANTFTVTGSFNTGAGGFSGTVTGTLTGTPSSGTFSGVLTTNLANGCVAAENYSGTLTSSTLNWTPTGAANSCNGASPLTFPIAPPAAATPPVTATTGTYSGSYVVPVALNVSPTCTRIDTISGTLALKVTVGSDGTVSGSADAGHSPPFVSETITGTNVITAAVGNCSSLVMSQVGTSGPASIVAGDQVAGTTSNFAFTDRQSNSISGGATLTTGAKFVGAFTGNTIIGVFTFTEDIGAPGFSCNGAGGDCLGSGAATVTLTRQ